MQRVLQRFGQQAAGDRLWVRLQFGSSARRNNMTTAAARTGTEVDHMVGATDGVFIVFDHDEGVPFGLQFRQCVEQDAVVARMQADGRFIENVGDTAQIGSELRREADALGFTTRQCGCGAVQRQVTETDFIKET